MGGEGLGDAVLRFLYALARAEQPLVAAVQGVAVGIGTTMMLHCDYAVAASDARFQTPFVALGLVPEAASSLIAPRLMGQRRAFELLVMGKPLNGAGGQGRAALVNLVVPADQVEAEAMKAAQAIAALPPEGVAISRRLMKGAPDEIVKRIDEEGEQFKQRLQSDEARAAFTAFLIGRSEACFLPSPAKRGGERIRQSKRLQPRLDLLALRLQERRQHELFAELVHRLVDAEARAVAGDLEQDAVRLAEVEAAEPEAVHLAGVRHAQLVQPVGPAVVLGIRRAERHVMHAARALSGRAGPAAPRHASSAPAPPCTHLEHVHGVLRVLGMRIGAHLPHAHQRGQHGFGRREARHAERDRAEPADLMLPPAPGSSPTETPRPSRRRRPAKAAGPPGPRSRA